MTELILFALVGAGLFGVFLFLGLKGTPKKLPDSSIVTAVGQMVRLEGLSFPHARRLLDDEEYQLLCSNPYLQQVAKKFKKERQELAIQWVSILLTDLKTLWSFRRFLIRHGAPARLGEELQIFETFVLSIVLLNLLKIQIGMFGPFALTNTTRRARRGVDKMSYATAGILSRIPKAGWDEVQRNWSQSVA